MAMNLFPVALLIAVISSVAGDVCTRIVTSNVGLTPTVGREEARSVIAAQKYSQLDADVVCSQEFWHEEDIIKVLKASPSFSQHYSPIHAGLSRLSLPQPKWYEFWKKRERKSACKVWETVIVGGFLTPCFAACSGEKNQERWAECIIGRCQSALRRISENCVSCIFQNLAASLPDVLSKCHALTTGRRYNPPGLLLLSKKRIISASYERYFSERMMLQRGYIKAQIEDVGTVVCTHLSSNLGGFFEYDLPNEITDYEVQQKEEINLINAAFGDETHILLGDMNTGPEIENDQDPEKDVAGEFPANYDHLLSFGYQSPYVTEVGDCTYCTDNPLVAGKYPNHIIDHVLFKGPGYTINTVERILNFTQPEPMSDHYGVLVEFCKS